MRVDPFGEVEVLQRRQYDHSRGCYYVVVLTDSGREVVATSPSATGPWRAVPGWTVHPQARAG